VVGQVGGSDFAALVWLPTLGSYLSEGSGFLQESQHA